MENKTNNNKNAFFWITLLIFLGGLVFLLLRSSKGKWDIHFRQGGTPPPNQPQGQTSAVKATNEEVEAEKAKKAIKDSVAKATSFWKGQTSAVKATNEEVEAEKAKKAIKDSVTKATSLWK